MALAGRIDASRSEWFKNIAPWHLSIAVTELALLFLPVLATRLRLYRYAVSQNDQQLLRGQQRCKENRRFIVPPSYITPKT